MEFIAFSVDICASVCVMEVGKGAERLATLLRGGMLEALIFPQARSHSNI